MNAMIARFAGIIMPTIVVQLYEANPVGPSLFFACIAGLASINTFLIPYDTRGKDLDGKLFDLADSK